MHFIVKCEMMHKIAVMRKMMRKAMRQIIVRRKMMGKMKMLSSEKEHSRSEQHKTFQCHLLAQNIHAR